jgi:broad specificity phosphatase PhoE
MGPNENVLAYFARHGTTAANTAGEFRGPSNVPLNEQGKRDAQELKEYFKDIELGDVFASNKDRTMDTAHTIVDPKGLTIQPLKDLNALNVGYLAGEPKAEHQKVVDYFQKNTHQKFPKGESIDYFRERSQPIIKHAIGMGAKNKKPSLVVAHSSIIHELNYILTGDHNQTLVKPGGLVGVFQTDKGPQLRALLKPSKGSKEDSHYAG